MKKYHPEKNPKALPSIASLADLDRLFDDWRRRRKVIAKAAELIAEGRAMLEPVRDEEQEAFDNLSEYLRESERGQAMEEAAANLDQTISDLEAIEGILGDFAT